MDFDQKLTRLERILKKRVLRKGEYTAVAKESLSFIEQALHYVFRQHVSRLDNTDQLIVRQAEADIGQGTPGIESFTLEQLVAVLRSAHILDAWERVSGKHLEKLRLMNLDELTTLYTAVVHEDREATRAEAEFLFNCLHVLLEAFGITSHELDESSPDRVSSKREAAAILLKGKGPSDDQDEPLLFVSYARADDQPAPGSDDGRITRLVQRLKTLLGQKLDREDGYSLWIDSPPNGNEQVASQFLHAIHQTTILIVILSRNYLVSDWCQREQSSFLDLVHKRARRESSVFVIERDRLRYEEWPPEFEEITGHRYPFWDELRYHTLLNDLSYDLADELRKRTTHAEIVKKVTLQKPSAPSLAPPDIQTIGILLFLDANISEDSPLISQICQVFDRFSVGYMLPLQSEKPSENREAFEQYVLHCDALVIVYGEVSVKWVSDQLLAIRKISWKREQPLTAFAIFDGPPPQKPPVNMKLPNMRILHCRDRVDEAKLLDFIESLQNERPG